MAGNVQGESQFDVIVVGSGAGALTSAVVAAIFLIIVADSAFALVFQYLHI